MDTSNSMSPFFPNALEMFCGRCGKRYIIRKDDWDASYADAPPELKCCPSCRKLERRLHRTAAEHRAVEAWRRKKAKDAPHFANALQDWEVVPLESLAPENDRVLYILGNGFDRMHGVNSQYYRFRESLGSASPFRLIFDRYSTPEDLWADFEKALARFDVQGMYSPFLIEQWLVVAGAYDEGSGKKEFDLGVEGAAGPILTVVKELPKHFHAWVQTLAVGTQDRPLHRFFHGGWVLNFNYTEFAETLYGVPEDRICYIHGCRNGRGEPLILGSVSGIGQSAVESDGAAPVDLPDPRHIGTVRAARERVIRRVRQSDPGLEKNCGEIIKKHENFFSNLRSVETVIVLGHSMPETDDAYYARILEALPRDRDVRWYFGVYCLRDLRNVERLVAKLKLDLAHVAVFRTDTVAVSVPPAEDPWILREKEPETELDMTEDDRWSVRATETLLSVLDADGETAYAAEVASPIQRAFFTPDGRNLLVVVDEVEPGILLFHEEEGEWEFVDELESPPEGSLLLPSLRHVFLTKERLAFVYTHAARIFRLADGALIEERAIASPKGYPREGMDIMAYFGRLRTE